MAETSLESSEAMIARIWQAEAKGNNAVRYAAFFRSRVLKDLRGAAGFRGAQLLQGKTGGRTHITVITY